MTLLSTIIPPAPQIRPILEKGNKGPWVSTLQFLLYGSQYTIAVDRQFGSKTKDIISEFQVDMGLTVSGIVDEATWEALDNHPKRPSWKALWPIPEGTEIKVDRQFFFNKFRIQFPQSALKQSQIDGYNAIFDFWEHSNFTDQRWLAYVLATAFHETGEKIEPVREGFAKTDELSIRAVTKLFTKGVITRNYALPEENGSSYFGRGLVQLTFGDNYKKVGKAIGVGTLLYDNPSLTLNLDISVTIMFQGMIDGIFVNGQSLIKYFNDENFNDEEKTELAWIKARKIINGSDRADLIKGYAKKFVECLN